MTRRPAVGPWNTKIARVIFIAIEAEHVISSAPMRELVCGLSPAASAANQARG